jgi:hypothetical protein
MILLSRGYLHHVQMVTPGVDTLRARQPLNEPDIHRTCEQRVAFAAVWSVRPLMVDSFSSTDIAGIEIPQCSSVLPQREVLPFWSEARRDRQEESSCCWA